MKLQAQATLTEGIQQYLGALAHGSGFGGRGHDVRNESMCQRCLAGYKPLRNGGSSHALRHEPPLHHPNRTSSSLHSKRLKPTITNSRYEWWYELDVLAGTA